MPADLPETLIAADLAHARTEILRFTQARETVLRKRATKVAFFPRDRAAALFLLRKSF